MLGSVINLIVVVGLYTFVGVSGVFSFGHAAFMAIGAYTSAILVIPPETKKFVLPDLPGFLASAHLDPLPATIVAGAVAAVFALVLSLPLARLSGLTAGLATFAVLSIVNIVARNWEQVTHGTAGVSGIPTTTTIWGALGWAMLAMAAAWAFQRSRIGLRLRASRENESAARSIGVAVARERTIAFVVSAFFVGVAGALFGMFIGSFNPDAFFLNITFLMIVMLVIGGTTSLAGAVVGTIAISAVSEILRRIEGGVDLGLRPGLGEAGTARDRPRARDARHPHLPARRADRRTRDRLAIASAICQGVRRMSRLLLLITASVVVLTAVASGASGSANAANEPIVIGTANSLTGVLAPFELAINGGMEVAADEINAAGGVGGRKIKIIHVDAKSDLNLSATAALDVIEKGAQVVVPICDADLGAPGARAANEKGVLAITCAGAPGIGRQMVGPLTFNTYTGSPTESAINAEYAYHTLGWRRAYFLCDRVLEYTKVVCEAFKTRWKSLGGKVVG